MAASDAYELDKDASKFISTEAAQIYTVNGGVQYAINECPMGNGVMAVGTYFNADGEYSISLADDIDTGVAKSDNRADIVSPVPGGLADSLGHTHPGHTFRYCILPA